MATITRVETAQKSYRIHLESKPVEKRIEHLLQRAPLEFQGLEPNGENLARLILLYLQPMSMQLDGRDEEEGLSCLEELGEMELLSQELSLQDTITSTMRPIFSEEEIEKVRALLQMRGGKEKDLLRTVVFLMRQNAPFYDKGLSILEQYVEDPVSFYEENMAPEKVIAKAKQELDREGERKAQKMIQEAKEQSARFLSAASACKESQRAASEEKHEIFSYAKTEVDQKTHRLGEALTQANELLRKAKEICQEHRRERQANFKELLSDLEAL
ncbi:MAG TPA: hypothetical protein VJK48_00695 [Chlamydiales bacterium]|nr:MAG: hypothetical protein A3F67_08475 [Verrucomicrobia bacterium RIFCSPHIGHO2_12_FULL_41_10]HLB52212.1 hypothetical protein [Chlamydiales bacterium]